MSSVPAQAPAGELSAPSTHPSTAAAGGERRRHGALLTAVVLAWWTANGVVSASQYYFLRSAGGEAVAWWPIFGRAMLSAYLWIPITVAAVWLTWRLPLGGGATLRRLPAHAVAALCVPVGRAGVVFLLNPWIGWYTVMPPFGTVLLSTFLNNLFVYFMLVAAAHAIHYAQHSRQREQVADRLRAELSEAQLRVLRSQLQPHFLFNTLNTISALVSYAPDAAEAMIARLSSLLRHTLERGSVHVVTLAEELDFVEEYVAIEKARFEDRLQVEVLVQPEARLALVPPLLLQPLVENAVRHGIAPRSGPGTVRILGAIENSTLHLQVRDDGIGIRGGGSGGLGLSSTRARLQQMYGEKQAFTISSTAQSGTAVEMRLPFSTAAGEWPANGQQ